MKYWELIADQLSRDGWTWGYCSYFGDINGVFCKVWMVDAYRTNGPHFIVHADDILAAFDEMGRQCKAALESKQPSKHSTN